jgi:hypothetical protein
MITEHGPTECTCGVVIELMRAGNRLAELIQEPLAADDGIETAVEAWESALFKAGKECAP